MKSSNRDQDLERYEHSPVNAIAAPPPIATAPTFAQRTRLCCAGFSTPSFRAVKSEEAKFVSKASIVDTGTLSQ